MPEPTGVPGSGGAPRQPQQPQQPQYGYQQPQQTQYSYQQPRQPQYNYPQPQQPQYNYPPAQPAYGYPPRAAAPLTHKKAVGSMVLMLLALTLLIYPLARATINLLTALFDYGPEGTLISLLGNVFLITGLILMLVGAIIGSRGSTLFGVGLLLCLVFQLGDRIYTINTWDYYEEGINVLLLLFGVFLMIGTLLAAIGCLARVKALKIVGGILMLVNFPIAWFLDFGTALDWYGSDSTFVLLYLLRLAGFVLVCIAVLCFPIRRVKN